MSTKKDPSDPGTRPGKFPLDGGGGESGPSGPSGPITPGRPLGFDMAKPPPNPNGEPVEMGKDRVAAEDIGVAPGNKRPDGFTVISARKTGPMWTIVVERDGRRGTGQHNNRHNAEELAVLDAGE